MPVAVRQKTERIDIRANASVKHILQEAARASHKNLSDYLIENGLAAAEQALADRRLFTLDSQQWKKFQSILDRPVKCKPRLKELLTSKGVFD
ncbi:MAG: DUF1778 domain-containing protein [Methylacidiphilales bacterium]|nr:DUF1778 domain-containing protein [Candidatus Methylacidiphilales bacterium]